MKAVLTRQRATGQVTAQRWIKLADRDLAVANQIFDTYPDSAAFHFQEAAGMYLKVFLASHLVPLKRSDSISTMVNRCSKIDAEFNSLSKAADLDLITEFATKYRYPNDEKKEFPTRAELMQARGFCEQARDLVGYRLHQSDDLKMVKSKLAAKDPCVVATLITLSKSHISSEEATEKLALE